MSKTMTFAHLIGLAVGANRSRRAEEDKPQGSPFNDDPGDQQNAKGKGKAKGEEEEEEEEEEDPDAEEEDDDTKAKKAKKAKGKAKGEDGDDDDDEPEAEEDEADDETAKAVRADRKRCAQIIAYGVAHGCVEQAGVLAFDAGLGKAAAISVLKAGGSRAKGSTSSLASKMSGVNVIQVGPEASHELPPGTSAIAAGIIKAGK